MDYKAGSERGAQRARAASTARDRTRRPAFHVPGVAHVAVGALATFRLALPALLWAAPTRALGGARTATVSPRNNDIRGTCTLVPK